jgi:uncharacterized membrane protein
MSPRIAQAVNIVGVKERMWQKISARGRQKTDPAEIESFHVYLD